MRFAVAEGFHQRHATVLPRRRQRRRGHRVADGRLWLHLAHQAECELGQSIHCRVLLVASSGLRTAATAGAIAALGIDFVCLEHGSIHFSDGQ